MKPDQRPLNQEPAPALPDDELLRPAGDDPLAHRQLVQARAEAAALSADFEQRMVTGFRREVAAVPGAWPGRRVRRWVQLTCRVALFVVFGGLVMLRCFHFNQVVDATVTWTGNGPLGSSLKVMSQTLFTVPSYRAPAGAVATPHVVELAALHKLVTLIAEVCIWSVLLLLGSYFIALLLRRHVLGSVPAGATCRQDS